MDTNLVAESRTARAILVVAGENRLTGQSRDMTIQTLAQAGHARYEVPLGPTTPAYYALVASRSQASEPTGQGSYSRALGPSGRERDPLRPVPIGEAGRHRLLLADK